MLNFEFLTLRQKLVALRQTQLIQAPALLVLLGAMLFPPTIVAQAEVEPGRQLRNLHGFSKLYGYVRFFYPSDEAQQIDWDQFAVYGARQARHAPDVEALRGVLEELYGPIAPALRIYPTDDTPPPGPPAPEETSGLTAVAWQHRGPGLVEATKAPETWASVRLGRGEALLDPAILPTPLPGTEIDEPFTEGLNFTMPIALWSDEKGTLPHGDPEALAALQRRLQTIDLEAWDAQRPGDRVALAVIGWNLIEHFYPYFPELGVVWEQQHIIALRELLEAHDQQSTYDALRRSLWAYIGDSQARVVHHKLDTEQAWPPFTVDQVDGYITVLASDAPGVKVGDDLETLNEERAGVIMQQESALHGGSSQWRLAQGLRNYGRGEPGSRVDLEVYRRGNVRNIEVSTARSEAQPMSPYEHPAIKKLGRKIYYFDLSRADMQDIQPYLDKLARARGVIFDLRDSMLPGNHALLSYLIDEPTTSAEEKLPLFTWPAELDEDDGPDGWHPTVRWDIEPSAPRIGSEKKGSKTEIIFLVGGRTVGEAEIFLDLVRDHQIGRLVGGATAGAAGTLHHFRLPGDFELRWTAAHFQGKERPREEGQEEQRHFLVGIEPDVWVQRTHEGVKKERDQVLGEALLLMRKARRE